MDSVHDTPKGWVAPFGHPRIKACSRLPMAFRSVPRPSSPPGAKASTECPSLAREHRPTTARGHTTMHRNHPHPPPCMTRSPPTAAASPGRNGNPDTSDRRTPQLAHNRPTGHPKRQTPPRRLRQISTPALATRTPGAARNSAHIPGQTSRPTAAGKPRQTPQLRPPHPAQSHSRAQRRTRT